MWYHAMNRGNRREAVFHKEGDYAAFVEAMVDARARLPVDVRGYCLMPNHFSFGPAAVGRRRSRALDAVAADGPRPPVSPALRDQRPCLARPVQGVPDPG